MEEGTSDFHRGRGRQDVEAGYGRMCQVQFVVYKEFVVNNMPWDRWRRWAAAWEGQEGHKPGRLGVTYAQL